MQRDDHYGAAERHKGLRDAWINTNDGCRCEPPPTTLRFGKLCPLCGKPMPLLTPYGDYR